ncbi:uncharacterized protein N7483_006382 [Penicillium malachiteum]|uniref:uncharacterized protein n=1 Tax=Penicillium malachiteum TaxID=1324776 RepID=UPI0025470221|nr:uncharacterized protein N7483_006382 [Penicillium malachiteum]KAJ5725025.1 hypothetical protein N7483_006382 [Penicillium malachiteum]
MSKSDLEESSGGSETNVITKPTIWQRFKSHMKKWWSAYLIGFICIFLVVFLPIIYVGIPHWADSYVDSYEYDETGLAITNPRPTAFHISQSKKISMGGGFSGSGHLSAFNASIRTSNDQEFAIFPVPEIKFGNGAYLNIDQDLDLSCVDCVSQLAVSAATNKSFSVLVKGKPNLKVGGLPTAHLNIHKTMKMNGFVNSNGAFNITTLDPLSNNTEYNFNATISLRNPTPFTVEMGHVTFNLSMGGSALGNVDLPNLKLEQDISSAVVLIKVNESMLIDEALLGDGSLGVVTIDIKGHSCDYNGQDIPYFAAAIQAVSASATVDLLKYASSLFD